MSESDEEHLSIASDGFEEEREEYPTGYDDVEMEERDDSREEEVLRMRQRNTDRVLEQVDNEIRFIRDRRRNVMELINTLNQRDRDSLEMVSEIIREAEDSPDDNQVRNAYGILRAQRRVVRDMWNETRGLERDLLTLEQLNQFVEEQDPDEMMRFVEHYNITLENTYLV